MRELFSRFVAPIIDKVLGIRCTSFGYQYSEIVGSLASVYFCGGDCVEDVTSHLMPQQVADWFVWLASTLGRFFDERSGRSTSRKGGACYRRDARKPSAMLTNVFAKPNEQNEARFNSAMARKRRMKSNSDVPTMKSTTLPMADMMGEYRSSSKGCQGD